MDIAYLVTPLLTWVTVGPIKFLINSVRARKWAFNLVGNGGFPSNHSAVVSSMVTLCFIVVIDANSLRQHVGKQAAAINRLAKDKDDGGHHWLRERMGHTLVEIGGGLCTGVAMGFIINAIFGRG